MALVFASTPVTSLTNQSVLNTVGAVNDNGAPKSNHSLFVQTGAGVSAGVVAIQVSNDNVNWFTTTGTVTTNAANTAFVTSLANFPFQYVRAIISTGITGGTITAVLASSGE